MAVFIFLIIRGRMKNKLLVTAILSVLINLCAVAMDRALIKKADKKPKNYGRLTSVPWPSEHRELEPRPEFRAKSDAGDYISPRSKERVARMQQNNEPKGIRGNQSNVTTRRKDWQAESKEVSKRIEEKKLSQFVANEERSRGQKVVFSLSTRDDSPVYEKFVFDDLVKKRDVNTIISVLLENETLRKKYRPASLLHDVYTHKNTTGFYIDPIEVQGMSLESFEAVAVKLAKRTCNIGFLDAYRNRK